MGSPAVQSASTSNTLHMDMDAIPLRRISLGRWRIDAETVDEKAPPWS
jgi:hypothetical protein